MLAAVVKINSTRSDRWNVLHRLSDSLPTDVVVGKICIKTVGDGLVLSDFGRALLSGYDRESADFQCFLFARREALYAAGLAL